MGRYINGDINLKLWFGIQSSDAADRFGVTGSQPEELYYYFSKDEHLGTVKEEITSIMKVLGDNFQKLESFFNTNASYTDSALESYLGVSSTETRLLLSNYADLLLGIKIRDALEANGHCEFTAEL